MKTTENRSDIIDRINQVIALGAILIGVQVALDTGAGMTDQRVAALAIAEQGATILVLLALVWFLVLIVKKWRTAGAGRHSLRMDDITSELVRKACAASWLATLGFTFLLDNLLAPSQTAAPIHTATGLTFAVMLLSYGIAFFVFDRLMGAPINSGGTSNEW